MWPNPQFTADLFTFTEETLNGKLHFLCSDSTDLAWAGLIFIFKQHCKNLYMYPWYLCLAEDLQDALMMLIASSDNPLLFVGTC